MMGGGSVGGIGGAAQLVPRHAYTAPGMVSSAFSVQMRVYEAVAYTLVLSVTFEYPPTQPKSMASAAWGSPFTQRATSCHEPVPPAQ